MGRDKMILLSTIINEFEDRFLDQYKKSILPGHKRALQAMKQCRQDCHWRIFSLPVDDPCPAKRLTQYQMLRLSSSMQQKAHHVSADGSAGKSLEDAKKS